MSSRAPFLSILRTRLLAPTRLLLALALVATLGALPSQAAPGEVRLSGGLATYSTATTTDDNGTVLGHFFLLGDASLTWSITEYWELSVAVRGGGAVAGDGPEGLVHALADVRYVVDASTWVPWLTVGVGAIYRTRGTLAYQGIEAPGEERGDLDVSVHAGLGLDYRPHADWSIGVIVRYNLLLTDDLARVLGPIEFSLNASYYL